MHNVKFLQDFQCHWLYNNLHNVSRANPLIDLQSYQQVTPPFLARFLYCPLKECMLIAFLPRATVTYIKKGWKFLKKLWCCVGGGNKVIWLYQLSWKCKLATVTSYKADVSSVSPSSALTKLLCYIHCLIHYGRRNFKLAMTSVTIQSNAGTPGIALV